MKQQLRPLLLILLILIPLKILSQHKVEGVIKDSNGEILIGIQVLEKDTKNYTASDIKGKFLINTTKDTAVLFFSYIGYSTKSILVTKDTFLTILLEDWYYESRWLSTGLSYDEFSSIFGFQISNGFEEHPLIHFEDFDDLWLYKISGLTNFEKDYSLSVKVARRGLLRRFYMPTIEYEVAKYSSRDFDYKAINFSLGTWLGNVALLTKFGHQQLNNTDNIGGSIGLLNSHRNPDLYYGFTIGYWNDYLTYDVFFQSFLLNKKLSLGIHFERIEKFNFLNFELNYVFHKVTTNMN